MPVDLPPEKSDEREPSPPNPIVWLILLVVTMGAGVGLTLTTWPAGEPMNTVRFWIDLFVRPFLIWAGMFGLRTLYYDQECARIEAENTALMAERRDGIRFASEPLAVLGYAYLTGAGSSNVSTLLRKPDEKDASSTGDGVAGGRSGSLELAGDDEDPGRYRACFRVLISQIAESVRAIPSDVPFAIRLHLSERVDRSALLESWRTIWNAAKLRPAIPSLVVTERGMVELDEWLDIHGGPRLEQCVLYVGVRLRGTPSSPGAEAASAVLLGWAPLVRRHSVRVMALLHRPVEAKAPDVESGMASALMWGQTTVDAVEDVWLTGVRGEEKVAISKYARQAPASGGNAGRGQIRDVTALLGDVGEASGWLAIALGIENALREHGPQLVACREGTLRFAVIQPDGKRTDSSGY